MSEELKNNLKQISSQLENTRATIALCEKFIESGVILIKDPTDKNEEPPVLRLNGDIINDILSPVIALGKNKKENLLAAKEQVLNSLEQELNPPTKDTGEKSPKLDLVKDETNTEPDVEVPSKKEKKK